MINNISIDAEETANELECLPYSVQHQNEGVCLLVRMGPHRILLDFGLANILPMASFMGSAAETSAF